MKIYTSLLFLFVSISLFAQRPEPEDIIISGTILEQGTNLPLEYATVSFTDRDNKIVTGGITNEKGKYKIEVPQGMYTVQFEFISYKTKQLTKQRLFKSTTLPTMYLAMDSESLDEVVVRAETTEVQVRLDKKIYNIGKDLTTSGATVSDALSNVPSVAVDVDGAISLRGNENVRILINGKPSAMAGFGSTDALSQLPADAIERVEVITSPSARYDAEGTAGILNIILRKEKTLGLNGSLSANYNVPLGSGLTTNINLRTNKFNIFNTTGIRYNDAPGRATFENTYFSETVENPFLTEERRYERLRKGFNTNLGVEYFINDNSSVTATGFVRTGDNGTTTTNTTDEYNRENELAINRVRTEEETEDDTNYQFTLNYTNKFDDNGHELTVDLQYENGDETERSFIEEFTTFGINDIIPTEDITTKEDKKEYLAKADYVLPIGENAQFEAGFNSRFEETATDYLLLQEDITTGGFVRNDDLSNVFTYNENINAVYSQYGNKFGEFSFLLGLRLENTQLKGEVATETDVNSNNPDFDLNFDKNYTGLFPTVNFIYELAENENISLGYNRRINRPRSWFINPFPSRSSEANIFQGNPNLDPAYASAFDLGYLKRWGRKLTLTSSVYYQHETDAFERVQEDTGEVTANGIPIIRTIPINLATNKRYGFEAGLLYNPTKWLRLNGSFNFFKFETEGFYNNVDYGTSNTSYFGRGSAKVSLPAKIEWQTNAFYRGPSSTAQSENEGILSVDIAFSKEIINDNATIGFNVRDLFNTRKRNTTTETDTFLSENEFQWRQRQFTVSFMYRFNEKKKRERPGRGNGGDGEEGFEG
ncbi:outer membrane beta-barrel family protein [Ulvibacter litoralis]|uniref:Outer membrane receptor proteins, mostly Fe transport n=1 Tax=Ulvibacter litoralis TaxID=227084 RepID=A0A1G7F713_9FLAO|nr:outer membrane beta-barrel family protein [Ulvibacter litoralis]GHC52365.1 TonB-dependent receptor [Ulvibacter litoralis]SDE71730.1 Outer membrane receptor proteins, mostly Fe transport [Ulvibacter litoralis]